MSPDAGALTAVLFRRRLPTALAIALSGIGSGMTERRLDGFEKWRAQGANVKVALADWPKDGEDWRTLPGYGWIFKVWFRRRADARVAAGVIGEELYEPRRFGRKIRVAIKDGHDGQRLADLLLARWPDARIQIRND